ncbi:hypothetical protein QO010_003892 [Caulobacter ginsengisoli]|uniref:Lipoprotein n=1 Tax=Caulobacter ginsengisoli TaxID=400775 RepID=A0ABU0IVR3_9CAUL|nr:hypothetical protein [Caulobacter ginsengisoli]MDQ0466099.1 hypothetical protein [Caulobacter ginsengisoli]
MRRSLPALAALAFVLPSLAHADWGWTNWTMSAAQVIETSGGKVQAVSGGQGDRVHGFDLKARGRTRQDGMNFDAEFYFDPDGKILHVVRLTPAERDCRKLLKRLKKRYGAPRDESQNFPMSGGRTLAMTALKWSDPEHGNFVAYTGMSAFGDMPATCFVRYRPLAESDPPPS